MTNKVEIHKKEIHNKDTQQQNMDLLPLVDKKIDFFKDIIQKTIIHVQKNKALDILGITEVNNCIERIGELSNKIKEIINGNANNSDNVINNLQLINNDLSSLLKNYGTENLEDLLLICFGNNNKIVTDSKSKDKFELLKKYFHPTSYKVISKKDDLKLYKLDETLDETKNLICYDVVSSYKQFHMKVYGMKLYIHSAILNKSLIIFGIIDDVIVEFLNSKYINDIKKKVYENLPKEDDFEKETFDRFVSSLILKDYFINENVNDIYGKFVGHINQHKILKQKQITQVAKEFISDDMYSKRNTLIYLLISSSNYESQYLAYLLYDLLSNDVNGTVDTQEQIILFDSFPWSTKQYFKHAMKKTLQYTNELSNFDINKIPYEQQICLMKAPDSVKEKAMIKLKEIKSKTEDTGSKARQYLDGLLKIPFTIYKREPILYVMEDIRSHFKDIYKKHQIQKIFPEIPLKDKYTSIEIMNYISKMQGDSNSLYSEKLDQIKKESTKGDRAKIHSNLLILYDLLQKNNKTQDILNKENITQKLTKTQLREAFEKGIDVCKSTKDTPIMKTVVDTFVSNNGNTCNNGNKSPANSKITSEIKNEIIILNKNITKINEYMKDVKNTLDTSVYGHDKAKRHIERVIAQWISGDMNNNVSHVLGFEGNPGIGKTTLAKCLSNCLKDENGVSRPFALIALGGDSNASTLLGHSYTYVGSNYGSIVQILIDNKCMNPIILFDEVDKISKTEHGKEITGVLTHLLDTTQNSSFQDKYFSGIDLDLSKALFILSYNDPDSIDRILLDRVHRIKFDSLSIEDKIVISNRHLLPELYKQVGLEGMIVFDDDVLKFIIEEYTLEPGVRKLKEKLFEIVGEINLEILQNKFENQFSVLPIQITINDVKNKYFKDKREVIIRKVPEHSMIGYANGMYATSNSIGGTLPIHAKFFPSESFLELKLTGLQQDVMKESMHISLTVAWNLTSEERRKELRKLYDGENNKYGINIHPGDGSVLKDGPSAGVTITSVIYSLLNNIPIKAKFGMTSEIQLDGSLTAIGGLNFKILGSIKAGVREFIYPEENKKDFDEFYEKYKNNELLEGVTFHSVKHISEVLEIILDKE